MFEVLRVSFKFMTPSERRKWGSLVAARIVINLLDVAAILAIGFVATSTAVFLTAGSDPTRELQFAGFQFPAVTAQTLPVIALGILVAFLVKALAAIWLTRLTSELVASIESRAAKAVAEAVFKDDLTRARGKSREELMFSIQVGSPAAFNVVLNGLSAIISEGTLFLFVCIGFSLVSLEITAAAIIYFLLVGWLINLYVGSKLGLESERGYKSTIEANTVVGDLVSVFRELTVQGKIDFFIDRLYASRQAAAVSTAKQFYLSTMPRYIIESALLVGIALFVLTQAISGNVTEAISSIGVFLAGGFRLTAAMLPLQNAALTIKGAIPPALTVSPFLLSPRANEFGLKDQRVTVSPPSDEHGRNVESINEALGVQVSGLGYIYPGSSDSSLENISFTIQPGSQVAFIGPSGSGKSTLADLICGLLIPSTGSIKIYGKNTAASIAYVPQNPGLVSGTILDNVALGVPIEKLELDRVSKALKGAHLDQVVDSLPFGFETNLGKLQDALSGGEIQRLGLARALYSDPGLLVMDEATSSLDAESEAEIQKALDEMRGKVTVILIAHRLNTIQHADNVILLDCGKIKDYGKFKDLLSRNPSVERNVSLMNVDRN